MKRYIALFAAVMLLLAGYAKQEVVKEEKTEKEAAYAGAAYNGSVTFADDSYRALKIDLSDNSYTVTDEDLAQEIAAMAEYFTEYEDVTDRPVENGDLATIDFVGTVDGVEFEGGSSTDYELEIGSNSFIDDFEQQLIGAEIGDEVKVEVSFPEVYRNNPDLAGKAAVFMVTIKSIRVANIPEMTDALAQELDYESLEGMRTELRAELEQQMEEQRKEDIEEEIWTQLEALATFEIDEQEKQRVIDDAYADYTAYATQFGTDLETLLSAYFGMSMEDFEEYCENMAVTEIKKSLMTNLLAEKLDIAVTDQLYQETLDELAVQNGSETQAEFEEEMGQTVEEYFTREAIVDYILRSNVISAIEASATITE